MASPQHSLVLACNKASGVLIKPPKDTYKTTPDPVYLLWDQSSNKDISDFSHKKIPHESPVYFIVL